MHSADVRVESFDRLCHSEVAKDLLLRVMQADAENDGKVRLCLPTANCHLIVSSTQIR